MYSGSPYYAGGNGSFALLTGQGQPAWRRPQLGALGALLAHWSLPRATPALISLPTGTGKTAVAIAAAHLASGRRVLVVVPSSELRRQMADAFRSEEVLVRIGALTRTAEPTVKEVSGRVIRWDDLETADAVVALPNSISPAYYPDNPPPSSLFDLVIIDEGHHAPARTWLAILSHFSTARGILLTATPRRRDGRQLPGEHVYHYPLRQALEEGIFKPVESRLLDLPESYTRDSIDTQVADEVGRLLAEPVHASSTLLVRAASRERAAELAGLYAARGIRVEVLHSGLRRLAQTRLIDRLRSGEQRGVAVVGMLVEGFDLPSLRLVAYHDKHKSLPATAQLVGRLARVDDRFPQPSVLVAARDIDVFPELRGVVRALYEEDNDWSQVLPGLIDDEVAEQVADRAYAEAFTAPPPSLSLEAVHPLRRAVILEVDSTASWTPPFSGGVLPDPLQPGRLLAGQTILYAGVNNAADTLLLVTTVIVRPRWHDDPGLDSREYDLHLVSFRQSPQTGLPSLLLVNTSDGAIRREILRQFGIDEVAGPADPTRLHEAFDSLERVSASSIGVRNTYASRGIPSYRMYAGSGVDRGLREADTAFGSLGHAMVQVTNGNGTYTAGIATSKGKYWETRYSSLREYDTFVSELAERYWFPPVSPAGQLLPDISRGRRLAEWPTTLPLTVEFDFALLSAGWQVRNLGPLDDLELRAGPIGSTDVLPLEAVALHLDGQPVVWRGQQDRLGYITADGADLLVGRGFAGAVAFSELLSSRPPTIFFADGTTVLGTSVFDSRTRSTALPSSALHEHNWTGVDIGAETQRKAAERGRGRSVHEALEDYLSARTKRAKHRWIIGNDGPGEIADYLVIELGRGAKPHVDLWHAKFSGGSTAGVRVMDLQELVAQAIKSRRWITDVRLWEQLGARLRGLASPRAFVVEGNARLLQVLCGEDSRWKRLSLRHTRPVVKGHIGIVQPGLSRQAIEEELRKPHPSASATQTRDLLAVFSDSVSYVSPAITVLCSA